jgi:hypothetical protein
MRLHSYERAEAVAVSTAPELEISPALQANLDLSRRDNADCSDVAIAPS